jgi:hypothetical protein
MVTFNIPVYSSNAAGYPHPPPQNVAAIFAAQGFGHVVSVDIVPRDGITPSVVWAVSPTGPRQYMAFVHCADDPNAAPSPGEAWVDTLSTAINERSRGPRTAVLHWDADRPLSDDDSPYWIIRRSTSRQTHTASVASYAYDPWSLQPIVTLRHDGPAGIVAQTCALCGHGTSPGWGVCPPGPDKGLRYDLRHPHPQTFGHVSASSSGDVCFTLEDFLAYYGPVGAMIHAAAPIATTPTSSSLDLGVTLQGIIQQLEPSAVQRILAATADAVKCLESEGTAEITTNPDSTTVAVSIAIQPCSARFPASSDSDRRNRIARIHHSVWTITQALDLYGNEGAIRPAWRLFVPASQHVALPSHS